jgi:hypothetical protein
MIIRKEKQLILFKHAPDSAFLTPIVPASKALPEWWQKASVFAEGERPFGPQHLKACMPLFDAMIQGYIIPLWSDVHVKVQPDEETGEQAPVFTWKGNNVVIEQHAPQQSYGIPLLEKGIATGGRAFKFINPWLIQTPKGYSTLFVTPLNNGNSNFEMVSAIVATDVYKANINLPFVWTGPEDYEGVISQGTPLVQLIPFKRDDFQHELRTFTEDDQNLLESTLAFLSQCFSGGYKRLWRRMTRTV